MNDIQKIRDFTAKCWMEDNFEDPGINLIIQQQMPDYEKYLLDKEKVLEARNRNMHDGIMNACYQEPILSKKQIIHLFRHYNYLKFCIRKTLIKYETSYNLDIAFELTIESLKDLDDKIEKLMCRNSKGVFSLCYFFIGEFFFRET